MFMGVEKIEGLIVLSAYHYILSIIGTLDIPTPVSFVVCTVNFLSMDNLHMFCTSTA